MGNKFIEVDSLAAVTEQWPFLVSGLDELNETCVNGERVSESAFFRVVIHTMALPNDRGRVTVLANKNNEPLAFGIVFENTERFCKRSAIVYAVYSNHKCPTAVDELRDEAERWARHYGYEELHAVSRRINGATFRIFEKRWGFRRTAVIFKKDL